MDAFRIRFGRELTEDELRQPTASISFRPVRGDLSPLLELREALGHPPWSAVIHWLLTASEAERLRLLDSANMPSCSDPTP